jgi:AraC-like DNA-binding protein
MHCAVSQNWSVTAATGVSANDLDEARDLCRRFYYPIRLDPVGPMDGFRFSFRAGTVGALTVGTTQYSRDLRISSDDLLTGYHVNLTVRGAMMSTHRGVTVVGERGRAVLYQPEGQSSLDPLPSDCRLVSIKIERSALEARLADALGRTLCGPLAMAPAMDVSRGAGRSWAQLAGLLAADVLGAGGGLAGSPVVAERLAESLINGLLFAVDHPYRDELTRPERSWRPGPLRRAVDAMQADPGHPWGVVELARLAEVSVRSLQAIFHRHTGLTPMAYLRELRLAHAHEELRRARPDRTTVAEVAHRWGFGHLGRFAAAYRERYGVSPSATLRVG